MAVKEKEAEGFRDRGFCPGFTGFNNSQTLLSELLYKDSKLEKYTLFFIIEDIKKKVLLCLFKINED